MLAGAALVASAAAAEDWPARPLHLVVPYAAGGPVDLSARLIAASLQQALAQPVVVENKPGAGGNIGADFVAKSAPDGYTVVMGAIATHAINPALYPKFPYDPVRDFRHIALLVQVPNVLVVSNDLPARSVADLIRLAKAQPGRLDFASGSTGSTGHLAGELFKQLTGTYMVHIPYKGSAPAVADLIAGRVQLMFDNLASALPQIQAGKARALAVTTAHRSSFVPELPTLEEAGVRPFDLTTWWGLMAPAGTPQPIVDRLAAEAAKALQSPELRERWRAMGSEPPTIKTPAEFTAFVERERKLYAALVRRSGATVD
ncbi:MAG: tripartite tricarboxylate transporter substrate binding protein [Betaproteobacteria bacterium]|nr:MAG: tripartite tricarboxylate transporter substrate binding protein [Betaproteobacteria bacterium]